MEEILIIIFQVVMELFMNTPWDFFFYTEARSEGGKAFRNGVASLIFGAICGGLSVYFFPDVFIRQAWLRVVLLFVAPPFGGFVAYKIAQRKSLAKSYVTPTHHFWWSFLFSLGYMIVRFDFTRRPL